MQAEEPTTVGGVVVTGKRNTPECSAGATCIMGGAQIKNNAELSSPLGGAPRPGEDGGVKEGDCLLTDSQGNCQYRADKDGNPVLDPEYAKKACAAYKAMMRSNTGVAAGNFAMGVPGGVNAATGGSIRPVSKLAGFVSSPGITYVRVVVGAVTLALGLGGMISAPPGCS